MVCIENVKYTTHWTVTLGRRAGAQTHHLLSATDFSMFEKSRHCRHVNDVDTIHASATPTRKRNYFEIEVQKPECRTAYHTHVIIISRWQTHGNSRSFAHATIRTPAPPLRSTSSFPRKHKTLAAWMDGWCVRHKTEPKRISRIIGGDVIRVRASECVL